MRVKDFDFHLPKELIAQQPMGVRDQSKLLHFSADGGINNYVFHQLPDLLRDDDVLVFNNSRVIPSRINGYKGSSKISLTFIDFHAYNHDGCRLSLLARPGKKIKIGDDITIDGNVTIHISDKNDDGIITAISHLSKQQFIDHLHHYGIMPLPPYIKRDDDTDKQRDKENYQTCYSQHDGSVAAPTAGLHFTPALLDVIKQRNIDCLNVILHVGLGTFAPIKVDHVKDHQLHSEYVSIDANTAQIINDAKAQGRRIISVGTTSLRLLEGITVQQGALTEYHGDVNIFITPGFEFKICDCLITNFHLPASSLFMLVCAFCGLDNMQSLYQYAIKQQYRFFSYGDASFLEKKAL